MKIQEKLLNELANKLGSKRKVAKAIIDTLDISQDSCYRRTRCETLFTIDEIQKICLQFDISFDVLVGAPNKNQIFFTKRDLSEFDYDFKKYLEDVLEEFQKLKDLSDIKLTIASQDLPLFKLFNFPQLTRFKFYFWSQNIVHKKDKIGEKFKFENLSNEVWNLAHMIHVAYASVESEEILNPSSLQGLIREIETQYFNDGFDQKETAIKLLNSVQKLAQNMEDECIQEKKNIVGVEVAADTKNYRCYLNRAYIPDNTVLVEAKGYSNVFLTHNVLNFLSTNNQKYIEDTKLTITGFKRNSDRISGSNEEIRTRFFENLRKKIDETQKRIEED